MNAHKVSNKTHFAPGTVNYDLNLNLSENVCLLQVEWLH